MTPWAQIPAAEPVATVAALVGEAQAALAQADSPAPQREARWLAEDVLQVATADLLAGDDQPVPVAVAQRYRQAVALRARGVPLARVTGRTAFRELDLAVGPATLEPRSDSEAVVEAALRFLAPQTAPWRLADLGTGTGCLLLALLQACPNAWGIGVDVAPQALATARANARRHGLAQRSAFLAADWAAPLAGPVDLVIANPPYVAADEWARLAPKVADFDPAVALDGGPDGLAAYRRIIPVLPHILTTAGVAVLETSPHLAVPVAAMATAQGQAVDGIQRDLSGNFRCVAIRPSGSRPGQTSQDETMRA